MCELVLILDHAHAKALAAAMCGVVDAMRTGRDELLIRVTDGMSGDGPSVHFTSITPPTMKGSQP